MVYGNLGASGAVRTKLIRGRRAPLGWVLRNRLRWAFVRGWAGWYAAKVYSRAFNAPVLLGRLEAVLIRRDGSTINYGVLGYRVVTTAFVNYMVDQLQTEDSTWGDFKFHDSGVGVAAENVTDVAMGATDAENRATGSQTESSANIYQSVGTIAYTTTKAITEHGLFNNLTTGILLDRTVFAAINVVNGDSIQFTYSLTCTAGS